MKPLWKYFCLIGMAAALISSVADVLLLYHPDGGFFDPTPNFYLDIPQTRLIWGHYLGIFFIPLELMGFLLVYNGLEPAGSGKAKAIYILGLYATFPGVAYHGTCAFVGSILQGGDEVLATEVLQTYANPLAAAFITGFIVLSIVFAVIVARGKSHFPRWMALCNPITFYLLFLALWFIVPTVGRLLVPAGFNLGMFFFLLMALLTFRMKGKPEA